MSLALILLVLALVCFLIHSFVGLAAREDGFYRLSFLGLGLSFLTAYLMTGGHL